jgi:radical SAM protein with 4Fe4S-binding SPASM domain
LTLLKTNPGRGKNRKAKDFVSIVASSRDQVLFPGLSQANMASHQPFEFFLQWHLTERCNLHCRHCYQSGAGSGELPLAAIREVAAEATAMLDDWEALYQVRIARSCNVTGGEPFLRADLFSILEVLGREGFALFLLSNGTLVDRRGAEALADLGVQGVQVSIEGPEAVHDGIRGAGSYREAVKGTESLLAAGVPVTFNLTLSRLNAPHLEEMLETTARIGVPRVGFSRLVPSGQGAALAEQLLAADEVAALYRRLFSLARPGLQVVTGDPVAGQLLRPAIGQAGCAPLGGCAAGVSGLTLLPDGTILPCRRLEVPLGNVRTDSLREIWASSTVLNRLRTRNLYGGKCGGCPRWATCRGCRAIAYACSRATGGAGDYLAEDPQCFIT